MSARVSRSTLTAGEGGLTGAIPIQPQDHPDEGYGKSVIPFSYILIPK